MDENAAVIEEVALKAYHTYTRGRQLDYHARDEILSDARYGAWQACQSFDGRGSLAGWAFQRAYGAIIDGYRSRHCGVVQSATNSVDHHDMEVKFSPFLRSEEQGYARAENLEVIKKLITQLTPREKYVIARYYFDGDRLRDIGAALGVTESMASRIHNEAIRRMRVAA